MLLFLRKHWFLLLIIVGTIVVALRPGWLGWTVWLNPGVSGSSLDTRQLMLRLILILVLPVGIGQLLRAPPLLRHMVTRHKAPLGVAARLLTVAVMLKAAVEVRTRFDGDESTPGLRLLA